MSMGMEFLVEAVLKNMDPQTKAALENIPRNVAAIAENLNAINLRLGHIEAQETCKRLEAIELELVAVRGILDGHTMRLEAIQNAVAEQQPGYTPDVPLPSQITLAQAASPVVIGSGSEAEKKFQSEIQTAIGFRSCLYSDAIGGCVLPMGHDGPHQCESKSIEAFQTHQKE